MDSQLLKFAKVPFVLPFHRFKTLLSLTVNKFSPPPAPG